MTINFDGFQTHRRHWQPICNKRKKLLFNNRNHSISIIVFPQYSRRLNVFKRPSSNRHRKNKKGTIASVPLMRCLRSTRKRNQNEIDVVFYTIFVMNSSMFDLCRRLVKNILLFCITEFA